MRLRDLHILLAVAKSGSIGKAASEFAVSQPVVSKVLSDLEHVLGVRLFDRSARGVEPTRHGQALLKSAIAVFDELRQGVKALEMISDPGIGELRLGCTEPLAAGFVGAVIARLSRQFPGVKFCVVTADPLSLNERELQQRRIELAVTPLDGLLPARDIEAEKLFDDQQVIVAGTGSKLARRRRITMKALAQEPWLLPPSDTIVGAQIELALRKAGIKPRLQIESFSLPLLYGLVGAGAFVTMLPMSMVMLGGHLPLKLLRVGPTVRRPTGIVTLRGRTRSALADVFIDCARSTAKSFRF